MKYSRELTEILAQPPSHQPKARIVQLRLVAEVASALHSLTDEQLAVLPDQGKIGFQVAAIATLDIGLPWAKFTFGSMRDPLSAAVEGNDWLHSTVGWLRCLHEWTLVDAKLRGTQQVPQAWADQSRDRRIVLAHTCIQLLDPLTLVAGLAEDVIEKATYQSWPRVRNARRRKRSSPA